MKTTLGVPDPKALSEHAKELASDGKIDPLSDVAKENVYLFSGNEDQTVERPVVEAVRDFLEEVGVPETNINLVEKEGNHAFITEAEQPAASPPSRMSATATTIRPRPSSLGSMGRSRTSRPSPKGASSTSTSRPSWPGDGFADEGVGPLPARRKGAAESTSRSMAAESHEAVGDDFIKESGFAHLADTNRLIILFPQTKASAINPQGCWDWWGYTDLDYLGKDAPQIAAIWALVEQLAKSP